MKKLIILLCSILLLSGCGHSTKEKWLFGGMIAANIADGYSTTRYLGIGGTEANPILDDHPSDSEVWMLKASSVGIAYLLGQIWPESREFLYGSSMIVTSGVAGYNTYLYEKHK